MELKPASSYCEEDSEAVQQLSLVTRVIPMQPVQLTATTGGRFCCAVAIGSKPLATPWMPSAFRDADGPAEA